MLLLVLILPASTRRLPWMFFAYEDGVYSARETVPQTHTVITAAQHRPALWLAPSGGATAFALGDVTGDGQPEWVALAWRAWKDWPIQEWVPVPSPIANFHDANGASCYVMVIEPDTGREIWISSALPVPLLALALGDTDGDGRNEMVTLEGAYDSSRDGAGLRVDVWSWRAFGFSLDWRSPPVELRELALFGDPHGGILTIGVR